MKSYTR